MAYLDNIEDMYKKLYASKEQQSLQKKQEGLAQLDNQQAGITNQYQELQNALNARKQSTQAQYAGLNTNLNNQQAQGKETYYNDRNNAAVNNVQRVQGIKDYMAKNNLMSSGENVDAMLRQGTDYNNNLGNIYSTEQKFNKGIADNRNSYALQEQNAYTDIGNQAGAAEREKAQKIAEILSGKTQLENSTLSDLQAYKDELDAKKIGDINTYNEQLRQEEVARQEQEAQYQRQLAMQREQQAASLRAANAAAARSNTNNQANADAKAAAAQQKALQDEYNKYYDTGFRLKDKGYTNDEGNFVDRYDNNYMENWINGLSLPNEYKTKLAKDLGVEPTPAASTTPKVGSNLWNFSPFKYGM